LSEPFLDTHVHFWDHSVKELRWPWLEPGFSRGLLQGTEFLDAPRYTPPEFLAESAGSGVGGVVHVQAAAGIADPVAETAWLQGLADRHGLPTGIVGSCTLSEPDAAALVHRHANYSSFCGVRDITAERTLDPDQGAGALDDLAGMGLSIEARRSYSSLGVLADIAARWPTLIVVLSHGCLPADRSTASRRAWVSAARRLARQENVVCKISAVAGLADPDWTVGSIRPWILACVEVFGPARCMLGSNWPIDRLVGRYTQLVDAYRTVLAELDPTDRAALFHRTATRVYHLGGRFDAATEA
jgi:predicted TIM-barrel fold metal-dependent hydrolase